MDSIANFYFIANSNNNEIFRTTDKPSAYKHGPAIKTLENLKEILENQLKGLTTLATGTPKKNPMGI